jgi:Flp pilus assembly pilin Flp
LENTTDRAGLLMRAARPAASFLQDEAGTDLVEYSLLLAFVCLAGAAAFVSMGNLTGSLWSIVNSRLAASNQGS